MEKGKEKNLEMFNNTNTLSVGENSSQSEDQFSVKKKKSFKQILQPTP